MPHGIKTLQVKNVYISGKDRSLRFTAQYSKRHVLFSFWNIPNPIIFISRYIHHRLKGAAPETRDFCQNPHTKICITVAQEAKLYSEPIEKR